MSDDGKRGGDDDAPLGGTVMMDSAEGENFGGTVLLDQETDAVLGSDAPLGVDGTVMLDDALNPADSSVRSSPSGIEGRKSAPPPLPRDSSKRPPPLPSTPPELTPTPAPPQAQDLTFDRSKLDADETTEESPSPVASSSFFKPAVSKADPPKSPAPTPPKPKPEPKPTPKPAPPAQTASPKAEAVTQTKQEPRPPAAKPAPKPAKKFPLWAQLLVLIALAGGVGHIIARMQSETQPAPAPAPKPAPKPAAKPKAKPPSPKPPSPKSTAKTPPETPARPAPAPTPVKAADLSQCVADNLFGVSLPSDKIAFVCDEADANRAQRDMTRILIATKEIDREARGEWNKLGWYRMAKLQIVRTRCCGDARPLEIVEALSACGLAQSLAAMHEADSNKTSMAEPAQAYHKAVDCLFKANTMRMFGIIARPEKPQLDTFMNSLSPSK